ncbi:hypothetical protein ACFX5E_16050, partial [Flavobacterium sp. LS2P90]
MEKITLLKFFEFLSSKINCWITPKNINSKSGFFKYNERNPIDNLSKSISLGLLTKKDQFKFGSQALFIIFVFLIPSQMQAQHPYGFMDGNVSNADGKLDWENVFKKSGLPSGSISTGIIYDGNAPDSIYSGGGTKDHLRINGPNASQSWQWKTADGSSSDKTNIQEAGAILIGSKIYFFGNRYSADGTTTIGFWFFQDVVDPIAGGRFSGEHAVGDILVVADISNGGAVGNIVAYQWVGDGNGNVPGNGGPLIKINTSETTLAATVNANAETTPWLHQSKNVVANLMPAITFFEGFIDLTTLSNTNPCFSSFLVETRSSNPVNSVLEDFTSGAFNVRPSVTVADITKCQDDILGVLTAVPSGGIEPLQYEWTVPATSANPGNASSFSPTVAGIYSVVVIGKGIGGVGTCRSLPDSATVTINPTPAGTNTSQTLCSSAAGGITASFDLTSKNTTVVGASTTVSVLGWYETYNAGVFSNLISPANAYVSGNKTVYAKLSGTGGCIGVANNLLTVNTTPAGTNTSQTLCSSAAGGITASFDLTSKNTTVVGGSTTVSVLGWYETYNAGVFSNLISPANAYVSGNKTVYAK